MLEILTKMYDSLQNSFELKLKPKDLHLFPDETVDVFKSLISLKKNQNDLYNLMMDSALSIDELKYMFDDEVVSDCIQQGFLIKGHSVNSDKVFIGTKGLSEIYMLKEKPLNEIFSTFDRKNFILEKELKLKSQEKIWCLFLLLFGADAENNSLDTENLSQNDLENYHRFLQDIEQELTSKGLVIGKQIGWNSGKDSVFRKFITNNVDLPKTGFYFRKNYKYYLDLTKRKNAKFLIDLILDEYDNEQRIYANKLFYDSLLELGFKLSMNLAVLPPELNNFVKEELNR